MSVWKAGIAVALAALVLTGCKAGIEGTCGSSSDCKAGLRCVRQVCVDPKAQHRCESSAGCKNSGQCFAHRGACVWGHDVQCRKTRFCALKGHCAEQNKKCAAGTDADCKGSDGCHDSGNCTARQGTCVATSGKDCRGSWGCRNAGRCTARGGRCVAGADDDCRGCTLCLSEGLCSFQKDRCVAATDADCKGKDICRSHGACHARGGTCTPRSTAWCRKQTICKELGRCSLDQDGLCVAATDADCRGASACRSRRRCKADQGECNSTTARAYHQETDELITRLHSPDEKKVAAAAETLVQRAWAARISATQAERIVLLMREGERRWKKHYPGKTRTIQIKHYAGKILSSLGIGLLGPGLKREATLAMRSGATLTTRKLPRRRGLPLLRRGPLNMPAMPKVINMPQLSASDMADIAQYKRKVIFRRRGSS